MSSRCTDLEDGYECVSEATFNGKNSSITYAFVIDEALSAQLWNLTADNVDVDLDTVSFKYRTSDGGPVLHVGDARYIFSDLYIYKFIHVCFVFEKFFLILYQGSSSQPTYDGHAQNSKCTGFNIKILFFPLTYFLKIFQSSLTIFLFCQNKWLEK
jgi:hypothetical protein